MVKRIPLTQGKHALVDDEDYELLNSVKWHAHTTQQNNTYVNRVELLRNKRVTLSMHRVVMGVEFLKTQLKEKYYDLMKPPQFKKYLIDHINHDTLDNRKENLRIVTKRQNNQNLKKNGTSEYPGVSLDKYTGKWRSTIGLNGENKTLGYYSTQKDAFIAYKNAVLKHCGEEVIGDFPDKYHIICSKKDTLKYYEYPTHKNFEKELDYLKDNYDFVIGFKGEIIYRK